MLLTVENNCSCPITFFFFFLNTQFPIHLGFYPWERNMLVLCVLLALLSPLTTAQTYGWGACPIPKVQPNFELQKVTRMASPLTWPSLTPPPPVVPDVSIWGGGTRSPNCPPVSRGGSASRPTTPYDRMELSEC